MRFVKRVSDRMSFIIYRRQLVLSVDGGVVAVDDPFQFVPLWKVEGTFTLDTYRPLQQSSSLQLSGGGTREEKGPNRRKERNEVVPRENLRRSRVSERS